MTRIAFVIVAALTVVTGAEGQPAAAKKTTADDVLKEWKPKVAGKGKEFEATGGSPKDAPDVGALSFRLEGWTFEEVWNFYADKCGVEHRYKEKTIHIVTGAGKKGSYVISDRLTSLNADAKRAVSVFLLKTDGYTATVSFHPSPDGKSILGSIAVVLK